MKNHTFNKTGQLLSSLQADYAAWKVCLGFESLFLAIGIYFLLAFFYFTVKTIFRKNVCYNIPGENKFRRTRNILLGLLIFYTSTSVFKFCLAHWVFWGPPATTSTEHCALIGKLFQADHSIGATSLFLFLWLRQHSLQQGSLLLPTTSSLRVMRFSWCLFVIIITGGFAATVGVVFTNNPAVYLVIKDTNACSYAPHTGLNSIIVYSGYSLIVTMQGCILLLFIYILRKSESDLRKYQERGEFQSQTSFRVRKLIRSCTIATTLSTFSNVTAVIIDVFFKGAVAQLVVNTMWNVDNVISLCCIVFCFTFWKALLLPWPCLKVSKDEFATNTT